MFAREQRQRGAYWAQLLCTSETQRQCWRRKRCWWQTLATQADLLKHKKNPRTSQSHSVPPLPSCMTPVCLSWQFFLPFTASRMLRLGCFPVSISYRITPNDQTVIETEHISRENQERKKRIKKEKEEWEKGGWEGIAKIEEAMQVTRDPLPLTVSFHWVIFRSEHLWCHKRNRACKRKKQTKASSACSSFLSLFTLSSLPLVSPVTVAVLLLLSVSTTFATPKSAMYSPDIRENAWKEINTFSDCKERIEGVKRGGEKWRSKTKIRMSHYSPSSLYAQLHVSEGMQVPAACDSNIPLSPRFRTTDLSWEFTWAVIF